MRDLAHVQLLERDAELSTVASLVDRAAAGDGGVAVLEGSAGIGKSALLERALQLADDASMECRRARGSELEADYPFGVVRQLFEPLLSGLSAADREELLSGAAQSAVPLFPDLGSQLDAPQADDEFTVLHGLYWLVAGLATRRPVLLAVDDAHWGDLPSLRWLAFMVNRAAELSFLLVVATRPLDPGPRAKVLDDLASSPIAEVMEPAPLGAASVTSMLRTGLVEPEPAFVAACLEATGGNPFFLHELMKSLAAEGVSPRATEASRPMQLATRPSRAVLRRLGGLSAEALAVAYSIAVLGDTAPRQTVAALAGLEEQAATRATDALVRAEVLRPDGLDFTHPLVRSAVYASLAPGERATRHGDAARLLASAGAGCADVALQLLPATPRGDRWAVEVLRNAAEEAVSRGAPDIAATLLERALAEPPHESERGDVLLELGRAAATRNPAGLDHLRESMHMTPDSSRRAEIALELGRLLFVQSAFPQAGEVLEAALGDVGDEQPELRRELETQLFTVALTDLALLSRLGGLEGLAERLREADTAPDPARLAALAWIEVVSVPPVGAAAPLIEQALEGLALSRETQVNVLAGVGPALMAADRLQEAKFLWDAGAAESRRRGSLAGLAFCLVMRAPLEVRLGSPLAAEADANELLELGRNLDLLHTEPLRIPFPWLVSPLIDALLERGNPDAAAQAFDESPLGDVFPELLQFNYLLHSLGRLRLAQGRGKEAVGYLRECGRRLEAWGIRNPGLVPWRSDMALALMSLGREEEARAHADEEIRLARLFEVPRELGIGLRAGGLVRGGEEGLALLREAVEVLDGSPFALERARALTELGAALRRGGHRADAREPLRQGLDLAQRSGATGLAERAHTELLATGARPRRLALAGLEALTASERRVAEMAAQGNTNRQIAEMLFVTEKTVEGHLHQAYQKLDIESRTQLPQALEPAATG